MFPLRRFSQRAKACLTSSHNTMRYLNYDSLFYFNPESWFKLQLRSPYSLRQQTGRIESIDLMSNQPIWFIMLLKSGNLSGIT